MSSQRYARRRHAITNRGRVRSLLALAIGAAVTQARAGEAEPGPVVRIWSAAVVVGDAIHLDEVCTLSGFEAGAPSSLADVVVSAAPTPGGQVAVTATDVRSALKEAGANLALVRLCGAIECIVHRPAELPAPQTADTADTARTPRRGSPRGAGASDADSPTARTLNDVVREFFDHELGRYDARADVTFHRTAQALLDLTDPPFEMVVRRRGGPPLGSVRIEVDVRTEGRAVQTIPLAVQVRMVRPVIVARGPINQDTVVRESDLRLVSMTFDQTDRIGLRDPALAVGRRARQFLPAGTILEVDALETVPLVERGQLVTLVSEVGGVQAVSSARAMDGGRMGDVITVRDLANRRIEYDGQIIGPGRVRVGPLVASVMPPRLTSRASDPMAIGATRGPVDAENATRESLMERTQ